MPTNFSCPWRPAVAIASLALLATSSLSIHAASATPAGQAAPQAFRPMFLAPPAHGVQAPHAPGARLQQWSATFTDLGGVKHPFTMVGTSPATSTAVTLVNVQIIPIKMVYGKSNGHTTFDPSKDIGPNGTTPLDDLISSPLFQGIDFNQGGTDLGNTQYIDAFQRGNFWYSINKNGGGYHVLLVPFEWVGKTYNVPANLGKVVPNPSGPGNVGLMNYTAFDALLQGYIKKYAQVNPTTLPLFLTDNIFLTDNNGVCCIGGYHSVVGKQPGGQTYAYSTYITQRPSFAQDVSALSHELGEWMDGRSVHQQPCELQRQQHHGSRRPAGRWTQLGQLHVQPEWRHV